MTLFVFRLSPRVTKSPQSPSNRIQKHLKPSNPEKLPIPVPDPGEMDWSSLVDTATRAMLNENGKNPESLTNWTEGELLSNSSGYDYTFFVSVNVVPKVRFIIIIINTKRGNIFDSTSHCRHLALCISVQEVSEKKFLLTKNLKGP